MASMQDALNNNYQGMTHTGRKPQGLQFAQDAMQSIRNAPSNILKWVQNNPVDAAFMAASTAPVVGDAIGFGKDVYDMSPIGDTPFTATNTALAGAGLLPFVPAGMGSIKKTAGSMADALNPDRAASIINDRKKYLSNAEQKVITEAENRTFGIPDRQNLIDQANETGNMIAPPWGAKGPKISLDKMFSMEEALQINPPPPGMYTKRNVITPEDIPIGSNLTNLSGDQSGIGVLKNSLSGTSKVDLDGGFGYPQRVGDDIWNSHGPVVNQIQSIADATPNKKTFALTTDMTPIALHFNNMVNKRFFELFDRKAISNADDINETIAKTFKSSKNPDGVTGFPGITSPKFKKWMNKLNGTNRSTVFLALDKGGMQKLGVPDLGEIKHSISSPDSRYRQSSLDPLVGYNAAEIIPGNVGIPNELLDIPHGTYPMGMKGNYPGGFDVKLPRSVVYPQWAEKVAGRGLAPAQVQGSFRQNKIIQPVTQQWQDKAMAARERVLKNK
jgi:hypothetical protein